MTEQIHDMRRSLFSERFRVTASVKASGMLENLLREHIFCTLWLDDQIQSYNTVLLDIKSESELHIDVPLNFPKQIEAGLQVTVLSRVDGVISGFQSQVLRQDESGIVLYYPDAIYQLQRRQLFRVPPAVQDPDEVEIYRQGALMVSGRMQDISAGGIRIMSRCPKDLPFQPNEIVSQLIFRLRDSEPLHMPAIIRFVDDQVAGAAGVILGVEFQNPPAADQEKVAQYVQTRDREILRMLGIGLRSSGKQQPSSWGGKIKSWWKS
ncbi:PilZ domain-containing protein [Acidithiobacillus thiooxidans]|uniref:Flagellar brake protein YcgR n=1 Tax=Acidithiobacillus thiooxidans ATCC 19377 TaxID=637390 RepID=A0A543Q7Z9_ACITH|nr:PilZ domain-containing protein [Acidithiobacillus thiooxidans]MDR7927803.1 PilZ domain-containing protein [Acidithiobacillus thiooxidans]MDX5936054.1 PilZ domain-containing protein [Acidithiobacillus thiooxidans]TQN52440.1 Flagellar brake protein YcgR [Acidithiobacillus thiooxidans ATCC 19377]